MNDDQPAPLPQHIWLVGGMAMLWGLYGLINYVVAQVRMAQYIAGKTAEELTYFSGPSIFGHTMWVIAVLGMLSGAVFLLMRRRYAVLAYWAGFLAMIAMQVEIVIQFGLDFFYVVSINAQILTTIPFVIAIGLIIYSHRMRARGVLR
ncbi:MAG: hypothetical protein V3V13_07640 [Paracoccaceae bacterium]